MLSRNSYDKTYVDDCRAGFDQQLSAYDALVSGAKAGAVEAFEPAFTKNMVLVLDALFMHRGRGQEGKDGNPLNEVRVLSTSILENGGVLAKDKQIKQDPERSVLGLAPGDEIVITREQLGSLGEAYFAEVEARFPPD
jgi:hypothetical protein